MLVLPAMARITRSSTIRATVLAAEATAESVAAGLSKAPAVPTVARKRNVTSVAAAEGPRSLTVEQPGAGGVEAAVSPLGSDTETTVRITKKVKARKLQPSMLEEAVPNLRAKAARIYDQLMDLYKDPPCPLDHSTAYQLLVCVILSAQARRHVLSCCCGDEYKRHGRLATCAVLVGICLQMTRTAWSDLSY